MSLVFSEDRHERFHFRRFDDGTEQYMIRGMESQFYDCWIVLERVVKPGSRRKRWAAVDRTEGVQGRESMYPPKVAGPFADLDTALRAYETLMALHGITPKGGSS